MRVTPIRTPLFCALREFYQTNTLFSADQQALFQVTGKADREAPAREETRPRSRHQKRAPCWMPFFSVHVKGSALHRFGNLGGKIFFYHFNAFAHFEAHETGDFGARFFGGGRNREIGIHHE